MLAGVAAAPEARADVPPSEPAPESAASTSASTSAAPSSSVSSSSSSSASAPLTWPAPRVALAHDLRLDLPVTLALAGYGAAFEIFKDSLAPDRCRFCEGSADDVNGLDRAVRTSLVRDDPRAARTFSDVLAYGVVPLGQGLLLHVAAATEGRGDETPLNLLVVAESASVAFALTQAVKFTVARERPYVAAERGAAAARGEPYVPGPGDDRLSFFSGHASATFAIAASSATVATLRRYRSAPMLWGTGMALAAATATLRMAGDKHYFTDVAVGGAVGTLSGVLVPLLFHGPRGAPREGVRVVPVPVPGGFGLGGTF